MKSSPFEHWDIETAKETYGTERWGNGYFDVSEEGEVIIICPVNGSSTVKVPLMDVIAGMKDRELDMPVLLRIENLLDQSISNINEAFRAAIASAKYQNIYRGVFPIKVNQQCHVVEEIVQFGNRYNHGLEAGSKPELIIAMASLSSDESYIVCNGYKDEEFIDLGLHAIQLGWKCFFVVETPSEVPLIIRRSKALGVKPMIGVRVKLSTKVEGHWENDSGDRSIFGLNSLQLVEVIDQLKEAGMIDCLEMLHFHLGSQIPSIHNIRQGVQEACRYYISMIAEGAPMGYLDTGGGLAVDYDGDQHRSTHSKNYTMGEYCVDIVEAVMQTLDPLGIPHPVLMSESGRATVAYSSLFLFNTLDVAHFDPVFKVERPSEGSNETLKNLFEVTERLNPKNVQECYNDAVFYRDEIRQLFNRGQVNLRVRAEAENLFLSIVQEVQAIAPSVEQLPEELTNLREDLADIYYGNFSVFQSLPDSWAIGQVFPIMPVHRLNEMPTREAMIADLTCDCDGKIDNFIGDRKTLPLHPLKKDEEYYLGVFLVGAYQETLSDLHNLFGDTNVVSIHINADGSFDFMRELHGDSIADVLSYVEYDPKSLRNMFRNTVEKAVRRGKISVSTRQQILAAFSDSLGGYTYYES
ncbi:biosynthetic arginine decarboxylase [Alkalimarinus coralli]|uniref:biosynthetic arginine decarboxylase n=1 Tax=Alkalimarinus coralli TaxID=2935863 RepID=UPI00202B5750|nr:biosynthetic arginine decarboxylase [Alkalimarinus coralli]